MSSVRLIRTNIRPELSCPDCSQGLEVDEWFTEYGDPIPGTTLVSCPSCGGRFQLTTEINVVYTASKIKRGEFI